MQWLYSQLTNEMQKDYISFTSWLLEGPNICGKWISMKLQSSDIDSNLIPFLFDNWFIKARYFGWKADSQLVVICDMRHEHFNCSRAVWLYVGLNVGHIMTSLLTCARHVCRKRGKKQNRIPSSVFCHHYPVHHYTGYLNILILDPSLPWTAQCSCAWKTPWIHLRASFSSPTS